MSLTCRKVINYALANSTKNFVWVLLAYVLGEIFPAFPQNNLLFTLHLQASFDDLGQISWSRQLQKYFERKASLPHPTTFLHWGSSFSFDPMDRILLWAVQSQGQWRSISTELSPDRHRRWLPHPSQEGGGCSTITEERENYKLWWHILAWKILTHWDMCKIKGVGKNLLYKLVCSYRISWYQHLPGAGANPGFGPQ